MSGATVGDRSRAGTMGYNTRASLQLGLARSLSEDRCRSRQDLGSVDVTALSIEPEGQKDRSLAKSPVVWMEQCCAAEQRALPEGEVILAAMLSHAGCAGLMVNGSASALHLTPVFCFGQGREPRAPPPIMSPRNADLDHPREISARRRQMYYKQVDQIPISRCAGWA